ncbi:MAG: hypothetical protein ACON5H_10605 [Akkermansiaceae bacterium]
MNLKTYLTAAIFLAPFVSHGQAILSFSDNKTYRQVGPRTSEFQGGSLGTGISDGSFSLAACVDNGSVFRVAPYLLCPLGTTGFVTAGDVDGDLVRDTNLYFSIAQIIAARQVEPFQTERIAMVAAPPSALDRPIGGQGWTDSSIVIWFDQINFPIQAYELTRYGTERNYLQNQLQLQLEEIVPGTYIFETPRLNDDLNPFIIRITHLQMIEAWPGRGRVPSINDFTLLNDDLWNDGAMEIDPRVFNRFDWRGFNGNTALNSDTTFFSIESRGDFVRETLIIDPDLGPIVTDVTIPPGTVVFPPYDPIVPDNERFREQIATPSNNYEVGPFFFNVGEEATAVLDFQRNLISTGNSRDTSSRSFTWDLRFVDTYEGFLVSALERGFLPGTTPDALLEPTADYDGDGYTNIQEYGLDVNAIEPGTQIDPLDPASNFVSVPAFNPADVPVLIPTLDPITSQCIFDVPKRPLVGDRLIYQVQYTSDLVTWTTITPSDPNWFIETDDETLYRVRSRQPVPPASSLLRVLISVN